MHSLLLLIVIHNSKLIIVSSTCNTCNKVLTMFFIGGIINVIIKLFYTDYLL